ncbi:MAG: exo-alpha-sialidase [Candidatus Hadarchaeales archaeon]
MKFKAAVGVIILIVIVAGVGAFMLLKPSATSSASAPAGFTMVDQTTQGNNTVTTYSGTGTIQSAYSAFDAWMADNGWLWRMDNGIFGGYTGHLYDRGDETAVVQATLQDGQVTVFLVKGPRPSGQPPENMPPENLPPENMPPENIPGGGGENLALTSDFQPCSGRGSTPSFPATQRLLIATSTDGLNFTRTNRILSDRATVPDAVVLSSGRILVYYVAESYIEGGTEKMVNQIVVAVSDDDGNSWAYKKVTFNGVPSGATNPVDPNIVLKPDGTLRLFATVDPDATGSQKARTYSFVSTDGGFTYTSEGERFALTNPDRDFLDPETFRFSDTNWQIWGGNQHATSADGNTFTYDKMVNYAPDSQGYGAVIADITDFSTFYRMYVHGSSPTMANNNWIKSLTSTDSINWTLESGTRLTVDTGTGKESTCLIFPTVVRLKNGNYLMIYETTIPQ